jgi:hypothetical protein
MAVGTEDPEMYQISWGFCFFKKCGGDYRGDISSSTNRTWMDCRTIFNWFKFSLLMLT